MNANELKEILDQHNLWLRNVAPGKRANLREANLRHANLSYADISDANLRGADLSYANLSCADLRGADLRGADLSNANLREANVSFANVSYAKLSGADFRGANLFGANLIEADLSLSDLSGANLRGAKLSEAKLSGAKLPTVTPHPQLAAKILKQVDAHKAALNMLCWHTCDSVHCLGGWAVTLHPEGKDLEAALGTSAAAALIFQASCGEVPDFFSDKQTAIEWLQAKAAQRGQQ